MFNNVRAIQAVELLPEYEKTPGNGLCLASLAFVQSASTVLDKLIDEEPDISSIDSTWLASTTEDWRAIDYPLIVTRHEEIVEIRESFRSFIESVKLDDSFYDTLALRAVVLENGTYQVQFLTPIGEGISGTYFLNDENDHPRFVLKPFDEEAGCINNPKWFAGLSASNPVRDFIPLYHSAMRETLAYQVAQIIGVGTVVPKTVLAIVEGSDFHDYSERLYPEEMDLYFELTGPADHEKLCSVQEYVTGSKPLYETLWELERLGLSDQEIAARFDQEDFENVNLLLWTTYDTDGHLGNFLTYPKGTDSLGNEIIGIKKIDNGLAFPDKNRQLRNHLYVLDNAKLPLSDSAKAKIANIDVDQLAEQFKIYHLESAIPALRERIEYLQKIVQESGITIERINDLMQWIVL